MASESGTTGIEPLYFGGTNPTGSAGGRGPSRTPFPIAEQATPALRLRAFGRNKATAPLLAQRYGRQGDFVHGTALLCSSVSSCHFGKTKHP